MEFQAQQQLEERRRQEEEACACTVTTDLFDLCPRCSDKAWHHGHLARKASQPQSAPDIKAAGNSVFTRSAGGYYVETYHDPKERTWK